jgi:HK97 gp10 family phage protein
MAGFSVNLNGLKDIQDALKGIDGKLKQDVGDQINASALKILTDAKRLAPVNFGQLRNQIALDPIDNLTYAVEAKASYSAYVEFGTGPQVSVPADFTAYAAQFKGQKGGKFKDFVDALTLWVKRKGIGDGNNDRGLAYVIARSILRKGMRPQPFLIPSYETEKPKLIQRLKKLLDVKS